MAACNEAVYWSWIRDAITFAIVSIGDRSREYEILCCLNRISSCGSLALRWIEHEIGSGPMRGWSEIGTAAGWHRITEQWFICTRIVELEVLEVGRIESASKMWKNWTCANCLYGALLISRSPRHTAPLTVAALWLRTNWCKISMSLWLIRVFSASLLYYSNESINKHRGFARCELQ